MISLKKFYFYAKTLNVYLHYKLKRYIPFVVIIGISNTCNLKCNYCSMLKYKKKVFFSFNEISPIIDQIAKIKIPYISFSGGEPLLCKDMEKIGLYAHKKGIMTNLNTNGTLITKERAKKIAMAFDHIRVSINGPEDIHDKIVGVKGSFRKSTKALEYLTSVKNRRVRVGVNLLVCKKNEKSISSFVKKFKSKADFISFLPEFSFTFNPCKEAYNISSDIINIQKKLAKNGKNGCQENFLKKHIISKERCDAGKLFLEIFATGEVVACPFKWNLFKKNKKERVLFLGNIYKENFYDIIKKARKKDFSFECDGCHAICTSEVSRIFRMNPLQLLKNLPAIIKTYKL